MPEYSISEAASEEQFPLQVAESDRGQVAIDDLRSETKTLQGDRFASLQAFEAHIEHEFCQESAIDRSLFRAAVSVEPDVKLLPGGEIATPIHEALNWQYRRFRQQANATQYAALMRQENGQCWQAKLAQPIWDADNGKFRKYESVAGGGSRAYLPAIDRSTWIKIAQKHGFVGFLPSWVKGSSDQISDETQRLSSLAVEQCLTRLQEAACEFSIETSSFWQWIQLLPIPIVLTEGGKKALALLSQGDVAIALYGVNGGYRKQFDGSRFLIEDLVPFSSGDRTVVLAFDQDTTPKTRRRVAVAIGRLGRVLESNGCRVSVAQWDSKQGKGVDDLIVSSGAAAWEQVRQSALSLNHWQIWQKLEGQLTWSAALRVESVDLSKETIALPVEGLVAIASPKASGKTKLMAQQVQGLEKVVSPGHRIALQRQLCERLKLDYIGDVDKAQGRFINGTAYTLRLGLCVDSLLAIEPSRFAGCDLICDEWTQLIRHLLTSTTCAKDGKRPALLARLRELIQVARRVIVADADLDNASLHYLQELRGDQEPIFLLRNDYCSEGYPVRFVESTDRSPVVADLLASVAALKPGQAEFVATDSKTLSKTLARLIMAQHPEVRVLLLNSETIGGDTEAQFNRTPDLWLEAASRRGERLVVIASPTLATGASIERMGIFQHVWGLFMGVSSTDADMSQSLSRVREPVQRIVWCAQMGSNFSTVSRSTNLLDLKAILQSKTSATVRLIRSSLKEDVVSSLAAYDWQSDPHLNLYCQIAADQNRSMLALRDALLIRLRYEGNSVKVECRQSNPALRLLLVETRSELRQMDSEKLVSARIVSLAERLELENREGLSEEDLLAARRFDLCDFYGIEPETLTAEFVLDDKEGRRRGEILSLEAQIYAGVAIDRTARALEKQANWNQGVCPWDISTAELRRQLREAIGLNDFLEVDRCWTKYDLQPYADRARELAPQIKAALSFSISSKISDTQIVHQLLSQLGIKIAFHWSCKVAGHEGEKLRVYAIEPAWWQETDQILRLRATRRSESLQTRISSGRSPLLSISLDVGGDLRQEVSLTTEEQGLTALLLEAFDEGQEALEAVLQSISVEQRSRVVAAAARANPPIGSV